MLASVSKRLESVSDTPLLDAQVLLGHILDQRRAWILAHPEIQLTAEQQEALESVLSRLEAGEPLPYVLGHWEFFGMDFKITPAVLIPRPETELLVEKALAWLRTHSDRRWIADVGTGSGCIAISLAVNIPAIETIATDVSWAALDIAKENALRHSVAHRVHCVQADLLPALSRPLDLICANLPYIPSATLQSLKVAKREPRLALDGGADGLTYIRRLIDLVPSNLSLGGLLLLEIEASQGPAAYALVLGAFPDASVKTYQDLAGHDRLIWVQT